MSKRKKQSLTNNDQDTRQYRTFEVRQEVTEDGIEIKRGILATDAPVSMPDWERMEMVPEVLCIDGCQTRGLDLKLVDSHGTHSVRNVLGSFRDIKRHAANKDTPFNHMDGVPDISKAEPDIRTKFEEGHINEMSVGYSYDPSASRYIPEGESYKHNGVTYEGPMNLRTKWTATEASLVTLGADEQAQIRGYKSIDEAFGSKKEDTLDAEEEVNEPVDQIRESNTMPDTPTNTPTPATPVDHGTRSREEVDAAISANNARAAAIADVGNSFNCREEADKAIREGVSTEAFLASVRGKLNNPTPKTTDAIPWTEQESQRWSLARATQALADGRAVDGLEAEVTQEIARRTNKSTRGFFIPSAHDIDQFNQGRTDQTLLAGSATDGAELVPTKTATERYIPFFTPNPVMWDLGATVITGITENFNVPVETSTPSASVKAEDTAHVEDQSQFGTVSFSPHAYGFFTEITKRLIYQSPAAVEQILRTIMNKQITIAFDQDGINGSGSGECDGIISHADASNVTITTAGSPDFDEILEFEEDIEVSNALEAACGYLTTPGVKKFMKKTAEYGTDRDPMWTTQSFGKGESQGMVNGYRAVSTNQSPSNSIIFGDFSYYWYVIFDGIEINVTEDAGLAKRRAVQFTCNMDIDGKPVKGAAFSHNV